jgi:hypothetical protein
MVARLGHDILERLAEGALALCVVLGSAFLWIGIPFGEFWLAGELTTTAEGFLFAVLGGVPLTMVGFGWLLYRLNDVYESFRGSERQAVMGRSAWLMASSEERAKYRRQRAPRRLIDVAMTASAVVALVLMLVWFFFLAGSPLAPMG